MPDKKKKELFTYVEACQLLREQLIGKKPYGKITKIAGELEPSYSSLQKILSPSTSEGTKQYPKVLGKAFNALGYKVEKITYYRITKTDDKK